MTKSKAKKVIICGSRHVEDASLLEAAINASGFEISEIISGGAKGIDTLAKEYAEKNKIKFTEFPAEWRNFDLPDAKIEERKNPWNGKMEKFVKNAGPIRNEKMAKYGQACIAIPMNDGPGTNDMIKRAKSHSLELYIHQVEPDESSFKYRF
jgi:hypothetical protein